MQSVEDLNRRYGAPGRIVFRIGHKGYPVVSLAGKYGSAEIALLGAHVTSYKPTGHAEVLFSPSVKGYNRADSVHGGMPLCWPQFGNRAIAGMSGHGFAKLALFEVRETTYSEEMTEVVLGLKADDDTRTLWPYDFDLEYRITLSMKLNLRLVTRNVGKQAFDFSVGLHPYLLVRDRDAVSVRGVDSIPFIDARDDSEHVQQGDLACDSSSNHVFMLKDEPKHEFAMVDPGLKRAIGIAYSGGSRLVVWNPGPEGIGEFKDLATEDWHRFICVEPVSDWPKVEKSLQPGEEREFVAALQSTVYA